MSTEIKKLQEDITRLEKEIEQKTKELSELLDLQKKYPDIKKFTGRWNKVVYCSKEVNSLVNSYDIRHNCGCCDDSPLELWPYFIDDADKKIYSDPPMIVIGEKDSWFKTKGRHEDVLYADWDARLRKHGISEKIIDKVKTIYES